MAQLYLATIYENPADFPGQFVGRIFNGISPTEKHYAGPNLDWVRKWIFETLGDLNGCEPINLNRCEQDHPQIVETWI